MALPIITPADLLAFAPEIATTPVVSDQAIVDIILYVCEMTMQTPNSVLFCGTSGPTPQVVRMARLFLAAHMATIVQRGMLNIDGPLTSESVGGVRRSYGMWPVLAEQGALGETWYGREYLSILGMSASAHGPLVV